MARSDNLMELPQDLPVPQDDGACAHLSGMKLPAITLRSTRGRAVDLAKLKGTTVVYIYPRTGRPDQEVPTGWNAIPGARGCTPQSCAFRDHADELARLGTLVAGLSAQPLNDQVEFAERNHIPYPVIADPERKLGAALRLPTFDVEGATLYKRITLVAEACAVAKVFYPVFPPDRNAAEVVAWLESRA